MIPHLAVVGFCFPFIVVGCPLWSCVHKGDLSSYEDRFGNKRKETNWTEAIDKWTYFSEKAPNRLKSGTVFAELASIAKKRELNVSLFFSDRERATFEINIVVLSYEYFDFHFVCSYGLPSYRQSMWDCYIILEFHERYMRIMHWIWTTLQWAILFECRQTYR